MNEEIINFVLESILINDIVFIPLIFIILDISSNYKIVRKEKKK